MQNIKEEQVPGVSSLHLFLRGRGEEGWVMPVFVVSLVLE